MLHVEKFIYLNRLPLKGKAIFVANPYKLALYQNSPQREMGQKMLLVTTHQTFTIEKSLLYRTTTQGFSVPQIRNLCRLTLPIKSYIINKQVN